MLSEYVFARRVRAPQADEGQITTPPADLPRWRRRCVIWRGVRVAAAAGIVGVAIYVPTESYVVHRTLTDLRDNAPRYTVPVTRVEKERDEDSRFPFTYDHYTYVDVRGEERVIYGDHGPPGRRIIVAADDERIVLASAEYPIGRDVLWGVLLLGLFGFCYASIRGRESRHALRSARYLRAENLQAVTILGGGAARRDDRYMVPSSSRLTVCVRLRLDSGAEVSWTGWYPIRRPDRPAGTLPDLTEPVVPAAAWLAGPVEDGAWPWLVTVPLAVADPSSKDRRFVAVVHPPRQPLSSGEPGPKGPSPDED